MTIRKKQLEKYYNPQASCFVLGCLMNNPLLLSSSNHPLDIKDFIGNRHKTLFFCINNLVAKGLKEIKISDIETYLSVNDPKGHLLICENEQNLEWLSNIQDDANEINYEYYYNCVRKMALLRNYLKQGTDVSEILDMNEIDPNIIKKQQEIFDNMTLIDIQNYFDKKNLIAKERFFLRDSSSSRKSGDGAIELRKKILEEPSYGFNLESQYLNSITYGALPTKFFIETRDTGKGKSRVAIKRLIKICAPEIWDFKLQKYIKNLNGQHNAGLYIGTEMDIYKEIEPMIWAVISGIEENKIRDNDLTDEENQRVDKAVKISKKMNLFLEDEENYDLQFLWTIIEKYVRERNINVVAIDYLELTTGILSEYVQISKGMATREDQVLLNLSKNIKNIAKRFNITIFGFTQTTEEARRYGVRDQGAVKGGKAIPTKADVGITTFEPTEKEMQLIFPLIQKAKGLNKKTIFPNTCYTIYKNRGGKFNNVKIWCYQNLGNMYTLDLFCTDMNYKYLPIDKKEIILLENNE